MLKATKGGRPSHRAHGARQTPSNLSCERPPQGEAAAVCASCTLRTSCVLPTTGTLHLRLGVPGLRTVGSHCGLWLDTWSHRCASEAETAFGDAAVFVEAYVDRARHVEVQVLGDAAGRVMALGDRDCSVQVRSAQRPDHRERLLYITDRHGSALRLMGRATHTAASPGKLSSPHAFPRSPAQSRPALPHPMQPKLHPALNPLADRSLLPSSVFLESGRGGAVLGAAGRPAHAAHPGRAAPVRARWPAKRGHCRVSCAVRPTPRSRLLFPRGQPAHSGLRRVAWRAFIRRAHSFFPLI